MLNYKEYLRDFENIDCFQFEEFLRNKKILITGTTGLICSALTDELMRLNQKYSLNLQVYGAGRSRKNFEQRFSYWGKNEALHFVPYDALEPVSFDEVFDFIVHGASNANPKSYSAQPAETMIANFMGTKNLLDTLKKMSDGRLLLISSSEVYGRNDSNKPYSETDYGYVDLSNPRACYPISKRAAETLCATYRKEYGINYVIVRPGHIYGPTMTISDSRAASEFIRMAACGKDIVMKSAGIQLRSYCYVVDCVSAILTVLLNGKIGEAYNISNPASVVTIRNFAECLAGAAGAKVVFENATDAEKASYNLMDNSSLTSDKLEALGWKGKYDLKAGVEATLKALQLNLNE